MALSSAISFLSALGGAWLPVLADAAIKGSAILVLACLVSVLVRRASAATRHLVWFLALVGLLGLPALSVALPGWQVLPGWLDLKEAGAPDVQEPGPSPLPASAAMQPETDAAGAGDYLAGPTDAVPAPARPASAAGDALPSPAAGEARPWSAAGLRVWILPIWALGTVVTLAPMLAAMVSLWRLRRASRRVTGGPWQSLLGRLAADLGLTRRVVLLRSSRRTMPMAWGVLRPKLLIPDEAEEWSAECLRAVLLHELAHVKRWDCLTQLVMRVACGLYWFNPLAWVALNRAVAEHERACDDVVLAAGGRAPEYAEHLLKVASRLPAAQFCLGVGIALARPSRLEGRLLAILDRQRSRRAVTWGAAVAAVVALVCVVAPLAVMRPMVQAAPPDSTSASAGMPDARPAPTGDSVAAGGTSHLRGGDTTDAGLKTYARLKNREGVEVESIAGSKITDAGLKELADFRNLRALNLTCARGVTDAGMKELKGCTGLRELRLVNTGVSNAGLAELKGLDALEALYLSGPKITDAGLKALKDFKGLREVCLLGPAFTDAGLKELKDLKGLRMLHLCGAGITDAGLRELKGFSGLQVLSLPDTSITDAGLKELKDLEGLRELGLRYTKVTDAGMRDVAAFKALRTLDLTYTNVTDAGLKELEGLQGLRELHCVGAAVTEAGVERLRKALPQAKIIAGEGAGARPTLDPAAKSGEPDSGASPAPAAPPAGPAPAAASEKPAPEPAPPDEVLKQLGTILELEEQMLAGAQERFRVGRGSEEDVGRQQVKVIDAKVRLAERKAELAARPKGDPRPPASPPSAALAAEIREHVTTAVAQEEALLALVQERYRVGRATAEEFDRQQVRLAEAKLRLARLPAVPAAAPATSPDTSAAATPILKIRSTDGAAVADVHDGAVRVRLGDKTVEGPTIIVSLDSGASGPRKGIALTVRDGAVRLSANGTETLGDRITIHSDGRVETSSREATEGSLKGPTPAGADMVRPAEPGRAKPDNALPAGGAGTPAGRQVFPLKYREADASEAVVSGNTFQHCLPGRPAEAKAVPADLSGQARYFLLPIGGRKVLTVLDASPSPRLFVDVAGTGDLAAAQPLPAKPWGPLHQFGPVAIPVDGQAGRVARVRFLSSLEKNDKDIAVAPAGYMAGEVNLDGQAYRVALVDHSLSGRYDNVRQGDGTPDSEAAQTYLAIDLNQDGRLEPPGASASETFDLLPTLHVGSAYYRVRVAPDGSSMALTDAKPDFGTLDTGCADLSLALVGEYGFRRLSGSGGKWQVPAGWHAATDAALNRTDAAGTLWSLHGVSSWGRLARFDTRAGQVLSLRAGPPLSVKVHPSGLQPNGMIHFALALVGQAGENYNAAPKRGGVPQPPRFRVLDEAGSAIGSGVFNAGSERTYCWCWWRVPEGFKGKYRVEVEGDFGPFEIARSEPEWFSAR